jgi:hypothetical protein
MPTVDNFAALRQAHRDGLSIRRIAKHFGVGRDTVRKALQHPEPPPYTATQPRPAPTFGPFREIAAAILAADATAPRKQRPTARQLFRRLRDEYGYTGGLRRPVRDEWRQLPLPGVDESQEGQGPQEGQVTPLSPRPGGPGFDAEGGPELDADYHRAR